MQSQAYFVAHHVIEIYVNAVSPQLKRQPFSDPSIGGYGEFALRKQEFISTFFQR